MKTHDARCYMSDEDWSRTATARCDLEHQDCEENRFCRESARREKEKRSEICR